MCCFIGLSLFSMASDINRDYWEAIPFHFKSHHKVFLDEKSIMNSPVHKKYINTLDQAPIP